MRGHSLPFPLQPAVPCCLWSHEFAFIGSSNMTPSVCEGECSLLLFVCQEGVGRWLRGVTLYTLAARIVHHRSHRWDKHCVRPGWWCSHAAAQPQAVLLLRHMVWQCDSSCWLSTEGCGASSPAAPFYKMLLSESPGSALGAGKPMSYSWISEVEIYQSSTIRR